MKARTIAPAITATPIINMIQLTDVIFAFPEAVEQVLNQSAMRRAHCERCTRINVRALRLRPWAVATFVPKRPDK
jgi:hypothetical protein